MTPEALEHRPPHRLEIRMAVRSAGAVENLERGRVLALPDIQPREREREGRLLRVQRERLLQLTLREVQSTLLEQQRHIRLARGHMPCVDAQSRLELAFGLAQAPAVQEQ